MSSLYSPAPALPRPATDWIGRILGLALVVGLGILLGVEYMTPEKRSLQVLAAIVVAGVAWRLNTLSGIGFLILFLPFPRSTVFGSTNLAFILLLLILWLVRVTQRMTVPPRRTALDVPILGLVVCYIVSFYNIARPEHVPLAFAQAMLFFSTVMMFYLIVNNVRNEHDLIRFHRYQVIVLTVVAGLCVWELSHPGQALFKGWIEFRGTRGEVFDTRNVRIGGVFFDYELLSEYCALNILFVILWLVRFRSMAARAFHTVLLIATVFSLFATVTRGAVVALGIALAVLVWRLRRRLRIVPAVITAGAVVALFFGMNYYVAHFTRSGDLIQRLAGSHLIRGLPDTRAATWPEAWQRLLEHPIIGHGPYYAAEHGLGFWFWPHDIYLYVGNLVGLVGLSFFLWLLFRMLAITWPRVDDLAHPSYTEAYLLIVNTQLILFMVDQVKIEYLRNSIYQYQVWLLFAGAVAAAHIAQRQRQGRPE